MYITHVLSTNVGCCAPRTHDYWVVAVYGDILAPLPPGAKGRSLCP